MPDLSGVRERDAQIILTSLGFAEANVHFVESYEDLGTVVHQHPMKGQLVDNTTLVRLKIAKRNYIQFLPQIYQVETATGHGFLREFLWIFQHQLESISGKLDGGHRYYDPRETPDDFLPWLASWVAMALDVDWPAVKKRKMIRAAAEMYKYRGTRRALKEMLAIFIGRTPSIEENAWPYEGFRVGVSSTVAEDTIILPAINLDHCFMVHVPIAPEDITEEMVVKVHNIIKMEKPAHSMYFLQFKTEDDKAKPQLFMQIGVSALGVSDLRYDEDEEEPARPEGAAEAMQEPAKPKPKAKAKARAKPAKKSTRGTTKDASGDGAKRKEEGATSEGGGSDETTRESTDKSKSGSSKKKK